ncbi:MAG: hypothetical protein Q9N68_06015 [Gammaproteobacteria bacterium]|nr:hypothetical protein [Gammaproteobacteria bacterium]
MSKYESFSDDSNGKSRWLLPLLLLTAVVVAFYMEIPQKWWPPVQQMLGMSEEDQGEDNKTLSLSPMSESRTELPASDRFTQAHQTALDAIKTPDSEMQDKRPSTGDELLDMESLINDKLNQLSQTQQNREGLKEEISDLQVEIEQSNQRVVKKQQRLEALQTR